VAPAGTHVCVCVCMSECVCVHVTVWMLGITYESTGVRVSGSTRNDSRCVAVCTRVGIDSMQRGDCYTEYGVAMISKLLIMIGLFCRK